MRLRRRVYVAGPMTKGSMGDNIRAAMWAAHQLILGGYAPFVPHLFFHMELAFPLDYDVMLDVDRSYVVTADALLRLPGESQGSDREVAWAKEAGVPVFLTLDDLRTHFARVDAMGAPLPAV